jgi:ABC-type Na+ efflux pump permease subunit
MRRAAYWLFPLIALAVAVFIVVFMIQINPAAPVLDAASGETKTEVASHFSPEIGNWIDRFSSAEEKGYFYPVNELTLELDANDTHGQF